MVVVCNRTMNDIDFIYLDPDPNSSNFVDPDTINPDPHPWNHAYDHALRGTGRDNISMQFFL